MKILMLTGHHAKKHAMIEEHDYDDIFDDIEEILMDPPKTWERYEGKDESDGPDSIISMEIEELNRAKEKSSFYEQYKEYCHLAAAVIHAMHHIKEKHHKK